MVTRELIELLISSNSLKRLQRSGWITSGVLEKSYESVAAHSWGTSLISLFITKQLLSEGYEVDQGDVLELAVLHDLPETVITDIPHSAVQIVGQKLDDVKKAAELKAIESLFSPLEKIGQKMVEVWKSSLNLGSIESRIVVGADIIDMLVHAISLERNGVSPLILDSFFTNSFEKINSLNIQVITDMYSILLKEHEKNIHG